MPLFLRQCFSPIISSNLLGHDLLLDSVFFFLFLFPQCYILSNSFRYVFQLIVFFFNCLICLTHPLFLYLNYFFRSLILILIYLFFMCYFHCMLTVFVFSCLERSIHFLYAVLKGLNILGFFSLLIYMPSGFSLVCLVVCNYELTVLF